MGVEIQREGSAAVVRFDWPSTRNAMGPAEAKAVTDALEQVGSNPEVAAVVLTGNGAFCSGGNLAVIAELAQGPEDELRKSVYGTFQHVTRTLLRLPQPTIAAVDGAAVGLGFDLALACDQRFVGVDGWFRQGWAGVGLIPGTGGELLLRRLAPALLWDLLAGERLGPREAGRAGIATPVAGVALKAALSRAAALSSLPQATREGYVRLHRSELIDRMEAHLALCLDIQIALLRSDGFRQRAAEVLSRSL